MVDLIDPRLKDVFYCVQADSFARQMLWQEHNEKMQWEPDLRGFFIQVGTFGGKPISVEFYYATINGLKVAFYDCTSMVAHWGKIEKWMKQNVPAMAEDDRHCNADNFHHCIHRLKREKAHV